MEFFQKVLDIIIDIASTPAFLVALIALLGLVLQKKSLSDTVKGTVKTFVGFLILSAGAGAVTDALSPFGTMFEAAFHVQGIVPNNEAVVSMALKDFGTDTALVMLFGMAFNILIARVTRFKYIYLTGHAMLYMAALIAVIMSIAGFTGLPLILLGGLALGLTNVIFPAITQKYTRQITGGDTVAMAHTGDFGYFLSGWIGSIVGDKEKSTEDIKFPKGLAFFRDSTVSITLTMMIFYVVVAIFAIFNAPATVLELSGGANGIIYSLQMAGTFAGGVVIILTGVRMILAEIVPAFKGISEKLVPNAIPALDCPIVFPYAPNAVLIGFLVSFIGGVISLPIMVLLGTPIILPGVVPHFFCGATAGVYGNATGGRRGAIIGSFVHGIFISFMPIFLMPIFSSVPDLAGSTFGDTDYGVVGLLLGNASKIGNGQIAIIATIFITLAVLILLSVFSKKKPVASESK